MGNCFMHSLPCQASAQLLASRQYAVSRFQNLCLCAVVHKTTAHWPARACLIAHLAEIIDIATLCLTAYN